MCDGACEAGSGRTGGHMSVAFAGKMGGPEDKTEHDWESGQITDGEGPRTGEEFL